MSKKPSSPCNKKSSAKSNNSTPWPSSKRPSPNKKKPSSKKSATTSPKSSIEKSPTKNFTKNKCKNSGKNMAIYLPKARKTTPTWRVSKKWTAIWSILTVRLMRSMRRRSRRLRGGMLRYKKPLKRMLICWKSWLSWGTRSSLCRMNLKTCRKSLKP